MAEKRRTSFTDVSLPLTNLAQNANRKLGLFLKMTSVIKYLI